MVLSSIVNCFIYLDITSSVIIIQDPHWTADLSFIKIVIGRHKNHCVIFPFQIISNPVLSKALLYYTDKILLILSGNER